MERQRLFLLQVDGTEGKWELRRGRGSWRDGASGAKRKKKFVKAKKKTISQKKKINLRNSILDLRPGPPPPVGHFHQVAQFLTTDRWSYTFSGAGARQLNRRPAA